MAASLANRSAACRLTLPRRRRAASAATALLLTAAVPGWASAPVALVDIGPQTRFAAGRAPAGGYLLVWEDTRRSSFVLTAQRFTAAGRPLGPIKGLAIGPPGTQVTVSSVAFDDSGVWGVFWVEGAGADQVGVGGALFNAHNRLLKRMSFPDPIPDPGGLIISYHPLAVALPGGGFFVAFEVGTQEDPSAIRCVQPGATSTS